MTFSIKTAHVLAGASQAVYLDESEVEDWATDRGFNEFMWFDTHDTQAAVMADDDRCILAFRGTESIADWLTDMDVFKEPGVYGRVHQGFQGALNDVWPEIAPVLAGLSDRELFVTGHSLGAALATLATAEWARGPCILSGLPVWVTSVLPNGLTTNIDPTDL